MGEQKKVWRDGLSDHLVFHACRVKVNFSLLLIKYLLHSAQTVAHRAYCTMTPRGPFPGVKRTGREADRSPPSGAEVKKYGAMPPLRNKS
jgi:hypothetical protein